MNNKEEVFWRKQREDLKEQLDKAKGGREQKARRPNMNRSNAARPPLDSCPNCGGDIQSTRESYYKHLRLSPDGQDVVDDGRSSDVDGDSTVYCENDHTQEEMMRWVVVEDPDA